MTTTLTPVLPGDRLIDGSLIDAMIQQINTGGGAVSSFSFVNANGIGGVVTNPTTTPALTLALGAITPSSVAAVGGVTGSNLSGTNTGDQTITLTGNVTGTGTGSFATTIANSAVTNAMLAGSIAASKLVGTDIATVGTITAGVWNGTTLVGQYGGTGVANTGKTITLGGNIATGGAVTTAGALVTSGAYDLTMTLTGATNVTFPTSGTLLSDATSSLPDLTTIGTITSGTWNGMAITGQYGGTGVANTGKQITLSANLTTTGGSSITLNSTGSTTVTLPTTGTLATLAGSETFTNKALTSPTISAPAISGAGTIDGLTQGATTPMQIQGFRPFNTQTGTTYTLVLGDSGKCVTLSNASAITLTIPTNASVAFATGAEIDLAQLGAGQVTVSAAGGVTLNSFSSLVKIAGQYGVATLKKTATDTWLLVGNLG